MGTALVIFDIMHFLLISQYEFTHEIKYNGMTSFMEFMSDCAKKEPVLQKRTNATKGPYRIWTLCCNSQ